MVEYIEREEIKKVLSNEAVHCLTFQKTGEARGLIKAKEIISKLPSADVVKVVRCKDCKHAKLDLMEKGLVVCRRPVLKNGQLLPFNWETKYADFCSYGELKEREG